MILIKKRGAIKKTILNPPPPAPWPVKLSNGRNPHPSSPRRWGRENYYRSKSKTFQNFVIVSNKYEVVSRKVDPPTPISHPKAGSQFEGWLGQDSMKNLAL